MRLYKEDWCMKNESSAGCVAAYICSVAAKRSGEGEKINGEAQYAGEGDIKRPKFSLHSEPSPFNTYLRRTMKLRLQW